MDDRTGHWSDGASLAVPPWLQPHASTVPASGAWKIGDPLGQRQFMRMAVDRDFVLEGGGRLRDLTMTEPVFIAFAIPYVWIGRPETRSAVCG